jgi:hypothetical protein
MAGKAHQWLLLWAARKMCADGFVLGGFEAPVPQGGAWNALPPPFELKGFRPDGWGIRLDESLFGFAEAKSLGDLDTVHTRSQLKTFGHVEIRATGKRCPVYVAVPRSGARLLDRVLKDVGLLGAAHLTRIEVPDALLREVRDDCRR